MLQWQGRRARRLSVMQAKFILIQTLMCIIPSTPSHHRISNLHLASVALSSGCVMVLRSLPCPPSSSHVTYFTWPCTPLQNGAPFVNYNFLLTTSTACDANAVGSCCSMPLDGLELKVASAVSIKTITVGGQVRQLVERTL